MKNSKKETSTLPKNIQLTFITAAAIAFVVQMIYHISLLMRIYPNGLKLSQFTLMVTSYVLLPAILFAISFMIAGKSRLRFDRIFHATLLTVAGLSIHTVVSVLDRIFSQYTELYRSSLFINGGMIALPIVVTLVLFAGLLYVLRTRNKNSDKTNTLQRAVIVILGLAFIANAAFGISGLILRHIGSKDITNFITHPDFALTTVLPLAFFATAYLALQKLSTLNRLYASFIYAMIGVTVIYITTIIFHAGIWMLPLADTAAINTLDLQTIFASIASLAVYTFLIVTHNSAKKAVKKTK